MRKDKFDQVILDESDLFDLYMRDSERKIRNCFIENPPEFQDLELDNPPELIHYVEPEASIEEFDRSLQANWHMPEYYKNLDIAELVLSRCKNETELQRAGAELMMYLDREMFPLLQYLFYLVETMRVNNIVWGVGRGSSVASFVLYLIGVHKINPIYYDLDINDFLR